MSEIQVFNVANRTRRQSKAHSDVHEIQLTADTLGASTAAAPSSATVIGHHELPSLGRGLGCNEHENTALAMIAQSVCSEPARGNDMKSGKFYIVFFASSLLNTIFVQHK